MVKIQKGEGLVLRILPYFPSGREADLRFSEGMLPYVVRPDGGSVALRVGVEYDERAGAVVCRIPKGLLKDEGTYSVILNVRLGREVWASAAVPFAEVVEEGGETERPLTPIKVIARMDLLDWPSNVVVTGASPRVGSNGNWLTWDDTMLCYVDTGIAAGTTYTFLTEEETLEICDGVFNGDADGDGDGSDDGGDGDNDEPDDGGDTDDNDEPDNEEKS